MYRFVKLAAYIDGLSEWIGRAVSWLVIVMVLLVCYDVTMRFVFLQGSVALQELEWHIFALIFLLGSAYTFKHDGHVCVDIISHSNWMTAKRKAWINIFGGVFFLIPFCLLIIISSIDFVSNSFRFSESSPDPGGLPYRYLLKSAIPISFMLILLQGLASIIHNFVVVLDQEENRS
ncbi:MAG: TRAP transporter small permease subunit [Gammaproteobacteria bacterium]|nr:TRAP transporter small permease subunit [Gammaproteobacteria bacterium]